jgi:FkbM family methyltransferase
VQPSDLTLYHKEISKPEEVLLRLFGQRGPRVIFDIGACEGEDTVRYARRFPRAGIYSFEPLPGNQELYRLNLERHRVENAELVTTAMSDRTGEATFHVSSGRPPEEIYGKDWNYGNKSSSLLPPAQDDPMYGWLEFKQKITVPTRSLDDFCRERSLRPDFIHMDVQGAEHLVLAGGAATLPRVTAVWMEVSRQEIYRGQALDTTITQVMASHGFRLIYAIYRSDGIEGDHLYLNVRHPRTWPYVGWLRLRTVAGKIRRALLHSSTSRS